MQDYSFEHILLDPEQKNLLSVLVEATRNIPHDKRGQKFWIHINLQGSCSLHYPGLPSLDVKMNMPDIEILNDAGLINFSPRAGEASLYVTPLGFRYYNWMKQSAGQPVESIETEIKNYLDADHFQQRYPIAYKKWAEAVSILWKSESEHQFTAIGHHCREAMQEFATALVERYQPPGVDEDKAHTINRIKAVLDQHADRLGKTEKPFLDALAGYWEAFEQLIQRQEHGGQKEGEPLIWEDGRRVVFQTAIVMYEIDRSVSR